MSRTKVRNDEKGACFRRSFPYTGGFSTGDVTGNITGFSHMHDSGTGGVSRCDTISSIDHPN